MNHVKTACTMLGEYDGDVNALKTADAWLFAVAPSPLAQGNFPDLQLTLGSSSAPFPLSPSKDSWPSFRQLSQAVPEVLHENET